MTRRFGHFFSIAPILGIGSDAIRLSGSAIGFRLGQYQLAGARQLEFGDWEGRYYFVLAFTRQRKICRTFGKPQTRLELPDSFGMDPGMSGKVAPLGFYIPGNSRSNSRSNSRRR